MSHQPPEAVNARGLRETPTGRPTGVCWILALDLGVLELNLLGLHVVLDEVHLLIEAVPAGRASCSATCCAALSAFSTAWGSGGFDQQPARRDCQPVERHPWVSSPNGAKFLNAIGPTRTGRTKYALSSTSWGLTP